MDSEDSRAKQLEDMLNELKSRSKEKVILETGVFMLILLFLFVGNAVSYTHLTLPTNREV